MALVGIELETLIKVYELYIMALVGVTAQCVYMARCWSYEYTMSEIFITCGI